MDLRQHQEPIVVTKPVRGREMRTMMIPTDMLNAMKVVSAKQAKEDGVLESLQKPREGNVEIYHEGYIDGKLYLVPDSNLEAMKDIVNLKMRRRQSSSAKPHTSLDEPSQYSEFTAKLDTLLGKIDKLAVESDESFEEETFEKPEEPQGEEENEIMDKERMELKEREGDESSVSEKQYKEPIDRRKYKERSMERGHEKKDEYDQESKQSSVKTSEKIFKLSEISDVIPPILDETIKYKRVRPPKVSSYRSYDESITSIGKQSGQTLDFKQHDQFTQNGIKEEIDPLGKVSISKEEEFNQISQYAKPDLDTETFRLLISGHFKHGTTPIFIIHQNCTQTNILGNQSPDFKSHRKEGNIDIFISGKFFTENILTKDSPESPTTLNVNLNKIVIDNNSRVYRNKFRDVYSVGSVDIALEGEFLRNEAISKYTPVLSLEILKHGFDAEVTKEQTPLTVLHKRQALDTPLVERSRHSNMRDDDSGCADKKLKHVHYALESKKSIHESLLGSEPKEDIKDKGLLKKIMGGTLYKVIFTKKKNKVNGDMVHESSSLLQTKPHSAKITRGSRPGGKRSVLKQRKSKLKKGRRLDNTKDRPPGASTITEVLRVQQESTSPFIPQTSSKDEKTNEATKTSEETSPVKKKKKRDKNQAIVENPILAQMQEFFFA